MDLVITRDAANAMPAVPDPDAVTSLCIWHCKYRTLDPVRSFRGLRALKIASFPDASLELLTGLMHLEWLSILHLPNITSLAPIPALQNLRWLELKTLPSWDASRKRTVVESLSPLAKLPNLKHLSLLGVVPESKSLATLSECRGLVSARLQGFARKDIERFFEESSVANEFIPEWAEA